MKIIEKLKDVNVIRNSQGGIGGIKGTMISLLEHDGQRFVEKLWLSGDWVFSADYEYQVEKRIYQEADALGLPVPKLLDYDDRHRMLRTEYAPGVRPEMPCKERRLLQAVLRFYDVFKTITFPSGPQLHRMDGPCMHKYRLDQLQYLFPNEATWRRLDALYESCLGNAPCYTVPFDRILHNTCLRDDGLFFYDFEWTIAGPHEFTLARTAAEFNCFDDPEILSRVEVLDLYHLCLMRFYLYGGDAEPIYGYLRQHLRNEALLELFGIVNGVKHADKPWVSK